VEQVALEPVFCYNTGTAVISSVRFYSIQIGREVKIFMIGATSGISLHSWIKLDRPILAEASATIEQEIMGRS